MRRLLVLPLALALAGCGGGTRPAGAPGNPDRGRDLIVHYGCGACHQIGGVESADGRVGPSLHGLRKRATIAGKLANTPAEAARWIRDPQRIVPGNDMPDLGVSPTEARDIVAYLYTQ
jgi:cytochrome c2